MALVLADRVQQTGTANTTVSFTLSGSVTGYQSFAVVGNGNTTYYGALDSSGNWEVGIGTYSTTGPTLTRTTILSSSNSGSAVTFSGTVNVFVTYPSEKSVNLDANGNVSALGTVSSGTWNATPIANSYLANSTISGVSLGSNLYTLTFGTHLTGTSYNGSGAVTLGTDATNANTASTIVSRDASGNFSAGTITASLSGNATTATTATNIAGGSAGSLLYQSGSGTTTTLGIGTSGYFLISSGSAPQWSQTLGVANGGTGLNSLTAGYIPYGNGTSALGNSAALNYSSSNQILNIGTAGTSLTSINQNNSNEASISFWSNNIATPSGTNNFILGMDTTANGGGGFVWNRNNSYLKFGTNNLERGRFSAAGNWLIGTTSDPTGGATTGSIVANGAVYANNGTTGGYWTSTYGVNVQNNIWAFANATTYGIGYYQGTAGNAINGGNTDTIGFNFGTSTAATAPFSFNANGALKMPKQPLFRASLTNNGDQTLTNSVLPFNVVTYDKGSNYNSSGYYFTAPIAGTYFFYVQTYGTASAGSATMATAFQVNGSSVSPTAGDTYIGTSAGQVNICALQNSVVLTLAAGDQVRVYGSAYNSSAVYRIYTGNSIFTGWYLG